MAEVESLAERARRKKRERDGIPEPEETKVWDPALLPDWDPEADAPKRSYAESDLDRIINTYPILEAYNRWVAKPQMLEKGEETQVSCPIPGHVDDEYSASINKTKNVFDCYVCEQGGDIYDLAAWKFGFDVPGYKTDKEAFKALRVAIGQDLGYTVGRSSVTGKEYARPSAAATPEHSDGTERNGAKALVSEPERPRTVMELENSDVVSLPYDTEIIQDEEYKRIFTIDWRAICPENTFLRRWCEIGSQDDVPEEYYFVTGLALAGCALGRNTVLEDSPSVYANLFLSLLGSSGGGKSKVIKAAVEFMAEALPFSDSSLTGTRVMPSPASAESLIDDFCHPLYDDPTSPTTITGYAPVRGIVKFDEFSTLTGRSSRVGSTMKPTLMEFYDCYHSVTLKGRTAGLVQAVDPFCVVLTTTQPRALAQIFAQADADSGFLNRWIFARGVNKTLKSRMAVPLNFHDCIDLIRDIRGWASSHPKITYTKDGAAAWDEFFHGRLEQHRLGDTPLLARIDLTFKKIILALCADEHKGEVTADVVERAALLYEYLVNCYGVLGESLGLGELEECMRAIEGLLVKWTKEGKPHPSIRNFVRAIGKRFPRDLIVKSLNVLEESESIARIMVATGKTKQVSERYVIVV